MYEKNVNFINNEALKKRLAEADVNECAKDLSYCTTPTNHYVLLKNGLALDDLKNPVESAQNILKTNIKTPMQRNDIIIVFGIGLCYLLDETFNTYPSRIILYEPDLKLLKFVLTNVDISEHLASGRIYITDNISELSNKLSDMYLTKDKVEIVYLPNYALVNNQQFLQLAQKVYDTCKSKMIDINTITRYTKEWMQNTLSNISTINNGKFYKLSDLEGKFTEQVALVAAAGPSLSENIEKIKKNRDRFIIFAVNKVAKYLVKNDIIPDFIVCLDSKYVDVTLNDIATQLFNVNCIADIRTDISVIKYDFNKIFINFSDNDSLMQKIAEYTPDLKFYETGGSASTLALVAAIKMGFSKIILSGLDLAFNDKIVYADGQQLNRIALDKVVIDDETKNLVQTKSVTGGMVYTREDYKAFIHHFEILIKNLNYSEVYNTTSFGAYIEGVKSISFDEIKLPAKVDRTLIAALPFKINIKTFIDDETICFNNIINELSKETSVYKLTTTIVKSALIYQYMQAEILDVLQHNCNIANPDEFISQTKEAIKTVIELLKSSRLSE